VLRDQQDEFLKLIALTPCSKEEFDRSWEKTNCELENARRFYVRVRQSFLGMGTQKKSKGWNMAKKTLNCNHGEAVSKWNNSIENLIELAINIRCNFQITNYDALTFIDKLDDENVFFYCDPPYLDETRASQNDYTFEYTRENHIELAIKLKSIKGKAMVSGYASDLYDNDLYKDWNRIEFKSKQNNLRSSEVQEVIWFNYDVKKQDLFNTH
jgi:DNA adenine methylase